MIITLDGPAGSGKSTVARAVAQELGFHFLDTGAMYRAVASICIEQQIDLTETPRLVEIARSLDFSYVDERLHINGQVNGPWLRTPEITKASSVIAEDAAVRDILVAKQQELAQTENWVTEGRDQGTVVFPRAACKIFLTANEQVRAQRRAQELASRGFQLSNTELLERQRERDHRDAHRDVAPLQPAVDAIRVDTSDLELLEVIEEIVQLCREKLQLH